jgi:hypothetical protein
MKRGRITLAAVAVGAFALTACGDDDDVDVTIPDVSVPDITLPDITLPEGATIPDITLPDITLPENADSAEDIIRQFFPGLDDDQVSCVVDALGGKVSDASQIMDLLDDCNIQLNDLRPGG